MAGAGNAPTGPQCRHVFLADDNDTDDQHGQTQNHYSPFSHRRNNLYSSGHLATYFSRGLHFLKHTLPSLENLEYLYLSELDFVLRDGPMELQTQLVLVMIPGSLDELILAGRA